MFELVLPKACMVGHVDFKFVLNSNITSVPQIQVTLLKNKAPGLGKANGKRDQSYYWKVLSWACCLSTSLTVVLVTLVLSSAGDLLVLFSKTTQESHLKYISDFSSNLVIFRIYDGK